MNQIFNEDCITGMPLYVPDASVDLIVTDPPFGIGFKSNRSNYNRTKSSVVEGYGEVLHKDYDEFTFAWMTQAKRALKQTGSMYVFSGWNNLGSILTNLDRLGFHTVNHIIWKYQFGVVTKRKFVSSHYHLLYVCLDDKKRLFLPNSRFSKEDRTKKGGSASYMDKEDVWVIPRENWTGSVKTPTKLPAEIIRKILAYSSLPDDMVLDLFVGSGQVPFVAREMGRRYMGFETGEQIFQFAKKRLDTGEYFIKTVR